MSASLHSAGIQEASTPMPLGPGPALTSHLQSSTPLSPAPALASHLQSSTLLSPVPAPASHLQSSRYSPLNALSSGAVAANTCVAAPCKEGVAGPSGFKQSSIHRGHTKRNQESTEPDAPEESSLMPAAWAAILPRRSSIAGPSPGCASPGSSQCSRGARRRRAPECP